MKQMQPAKSRQAAFTIVELIIVIAVIGILAAITIVSYTSTRNQADKSAYNATAQQVKMKLGEYYTDNNHYPLNKTAVRTYLDSTGANSLEDDFTSTDYSYGVWSSSAKASCASVVANCQYYEITVDKDAWKGDSADTDIVVKP